MLKKSYLKKERELLLKRKEELLKDNDDKINEAIHNLIILLKKYKKDTFWIFENFYSKSEDKYFSNLKEYYNNEWLRTENFNNYLDDFTKLIESNYSFSEVKDIIEIEFGKIYFVEYIKELIYFRCSELICSEYPDNSREKRIFQDNIESLYKKELNRYLDKIFDEYIKLFDINTSKQFKDQNEALNHILNVLDKDKNGGLLERTEIDTLFTSSTISKQYIFLAQEYVKNNRRLLQIIKSK